MAPSTTSVPITSATWATGKTPPRSYYYAQLGPFRRLIAMRKGATLYYVHTDHLGGTNSVSDASGAWVGNVLYQCFGETRLESGTIPIDKKFTGQTLDASTGLYSYGARYYDSHMGRFIQADAIVPQPGNPQSLNRYSYTLNNPLKYIDPSGNFVLFVGGFGVEGNDPAENMGTWGFLIGQMGLQPGAYGFFDWTEGSISPAPSFTRAVAEAAGDLARQIAGQTDITLVGHSKGGALVTEYLAQVAEGRLSANTQVRGGYAIDAPLDPVDVEVVGGQRIVDPEFRPLDDRYADLPGRLAMRGLAVNMASFDNPLDFAVTTHAPIPGIPYFSWAVEPSTDLPPWSLPYQRLAHGLLLTDPRVAAYPAGSP
ncbi:MAG: RHS repeat-associated core domain-containing protein [Chloroflexi bacterium]|nr:RHS repeat-associated core domain-containing protein [Chloroflexota bacterium]